MKNVQDILHVYEKVVTDRSTWDSHWEEIAAYILPRQSDFASDKTQGGEKRTTKIFDASPQIALERFAAVMDSMLTPKQQKWHGLKSTNEDLNKVHSVKQFFHDSTLRLFSKRYAPSANFSGQNFERWISVGSFGSGALFTDFQPGIGLRYRVIHMKNLYFLENHQGVVDTVFRKFNYTLRQAVQRWGEKALPEKLRAYLDDVKNLNKEYPFLHVVTPRGDYEAGRMDVKGHPISSYYICMTSKEIISEGGYKSFPFSISRYVTAPEEVYGRSPAMAVLPDIKMINEMSKSDIRAIHKLIDPPMLLSDDGVLGGGSSSIDIRPGAVNMGGVSMQGKPLIMPLHTGARVDIAEEKMAQRRKRIDDAFLITLFQILVENPRMTATEALIRAQEKGMLLAPTMGRQQSEALGPQIERELDLLAQHDMLAPFPGELLEAQDEFEIVYDAPANRLQRAEELVGIQRTMELLTPFANIKPDIFDIFDDDELARLTAEVSGVPAIVLRSKEQVAELRKKREDQQELDQMANTAQPVAAALKDAAQAQALLRDS
ncbi:MAG: phage head-tail adapter protein [Candidatus Thiodiazotropha sp. (ex Lucinoma aequizonata)]|nr:phage head-tail adapter protein [Candidatus Thiodiazotropha sp. (ex Lucinoma aequizonata)]